MKDYYFSHDRNALMDDKILELRADYGMEGYGCFWAVIEALSKKEDLRLAYKEGTFKALTVACQQTFGMKEFVDACLAIGLLETDGEMFWSNSLIRRAEETDKKTRERDERAGEISQIRKQAVSKRWERQRERNTSQEVCNTNEIQNAGLYPTNEIQSDTLKEKKKKIKEAEGAHAREDATAAADPFNDVEPHTPEEAAYRRVMDEFGPCGLPGPVPQVSDEIDEMVADPNLGATPDIRAERIIQAMRVVAGSEKRTWNRVAGLARKWQREGWAASAVGARASPGPQASRGRSQTELKYV